MAAFAPALVLLALCAIPVEVLTPSTLRAPPPVELGDGATGVHVVHTRFCLGQGDQPALVAGRMELLRAICLPSLFAQTERAFMWLFYIDMTLTSPAVRELVQLLGADPRFALVRMRTTWQTIVSRKTEHVYNLPVAKQLTLAGIDARPSGARGAELVYVSTRLDADDGLPAGAMAYLHGQVRALRPRLRPSDPKLDRGLVCWMAALDWYASDDGRPNVYRKYSVKHCVSVGLTTFSPNPRALTAHSPSHTRARNAMPAHTVAPAEEELMPLRGRSVTSDSLEGMLKTSTQSRMPEVPAPADEVLARVHNTSRGMLRRCGAALLAQSAQIAREQLARRCLAGFGCRSETQKKLQLAASGAVVAEGP